MKFAKHIAALFGALILAASAAVSPALASAFAAASDFTPSVCPASTGAAGASLGGSGAGFVDQAGGIWSVNSACGIVPSGQPTGGQPWTAYALTNSTVNSTGAQVRRRFVYDPTKTKTKCAMGHVNGSGSSLSAIAIGFGPATGGFQWATFTNGAATVNSFSGTPAITLVAGRTYDFLASYIPSGSSTTLIGEVVDVVSNVVLENGVAYASTTVNSGAGTTSIFNSITLTSTVGADVEDTVSSYTAPTVSSITGKPIAWTADWDDLPADTFGGTSESRQSATPGAQAAFDFTGNTFGFSLDIGGMNSSANFVVDFSVDGQPSNELTFNSTTATPYKYWSTLPPGLHTAKVFSRSSNAGAGNKFSTSASTSPTNALRINGFMPDADSTISAYTGFTPTCTV